MPFDSSKMFDAKKLYALTRSLKSGESSLSGVLEELRSRIATLLSISVLNVFYDTIDIGPAKGRPRLWVMVEFSADYQSLRSGIMPHGLFPTGEGIKPTARKMVLDAFAEIVLHSWKSVQFNTTNVLLIFHSFEEEALNYAANEFYRLDAPALVASFACHSVWRVVGFGRFVCVFFTTEAAKLAGFQSGAQRRIQHTCFDAIKKHDEFDFLKEDRFTVKFDTKENLDQNFEGNLFYYFH